GKAQAHAEHDGDEGDHQGEGGDGQAQPLVVRRRGRRGPLATLPLGELPRDLLDERLDELGLVRRAEPAPRGGGSLEVGGPLRLTGDYGVMRLIRVARVTDR